MSNLAFLEIGTYEFYLLKITFRIHNKTIRVPDKFCARMHYNNSL